MSYRCSVCGMSIQWEEAWCCRTDPGRTHYFCCAGCAELFAEQSGRFAARGGCCTGAMPRVGGMTQDEFEASVYAEWRRAVGSPGVWSSQARVLERCILSLLVGESERRPEVERLLAAELVRLRDPAHDGGSVHAALRRLPPAIQVAAATAGLPLERRIALRTLAEELVLQIRIWGGDPVASFRDGARTLDWPARQGAR